MAANVSSIQDDANDDDGGRKREVHYSDGEVRLLSSSSLRNETVTNLSKLGTPTKDENAIVAYLGCYIVKKEPQKSQNLS